MPDLVFTHVYPSMPLPPEIHPVATLESAVLRDVLGVWQLLPATGGLPEKPGDMLRHIKPHIKRLHLSEVVEGGTDFRFKIVGEAVFPGLGENLVGRLVSQHPDPGIGLRFLKLMTATRESAAPLRGISFRLTSTHGYDYRVESLWLPFGSDGQVTQIMGLSTFAPLN